MNYKINKNKIEEIEIRSFIKEWLKNTNKEIEFDNFLIDQKKMIHFYIEFLGSFLKNRKRFKIYGADKCRDFEINISNEDELYQICQDIWKNPQDYYTLNEGEDWYYDFLKFLWVDENTRLADLIVNEHSCNIE